MVLEKVSYKRLKEIHFVMFHNHGFNHPLFKWVDNELHKRIRKELASH